MSPVQRNALLDGFLRIGLLMLYVVFDISMDENTAAVQHIRNFHALLATTPCWRHASNSDMSFLSVSFTLDTGHELKTSIIGRD